MPDPTGDPGDRPPGAQLQESFTIQFELPENPATAIDERAHVTAYPEPDVVAMEGLDTPSRSQFQLAVGRFMRHRVALVAGFVLITLMLLAGLAPWIAPYDFTDQDLTSTFASPNSGYVLGTDSLGRDQLSRLLYGGRVSLSVGFGVAIVAGVVGTTVGMVAGYAGGWIDGVLMRCTDFFLALPALIFLIVAARVFGDDILTVVLIIAAITWMPLARIVRGVTLSAKNQGYVHAARASGAGPTRVIGRHILPNVTGTVSVRLTITGPVPLGMM